MLKNHHDIAFFVDTFIFELHENWERPDVRNLSFILSVHLFVLDLCIVKSSLQGSLFRNITLRSLLHKLTLKI